MIYPFWGIHKAHPQNKNSEKSFNKSTDLTGYSNISQTHLLWILFFRNILNVHRSHFWDHCVILHAPPSQVCVSLIFTTSMSQLGPIYSEYLINPSQMSGKVYLGRVAILGETKRQRWEWEHQNKFHQGTPCCSKSKWGPFIVQMQVCNKSCTDHMHMPYFISHIEFICSLHDGSVFSSHRAHILSLWQRFTHDLNKIFFPETYHFWTVLGEKKVIPISLKILPRDLGYSLNLNETIKSQLCNGTYGWVAPKLHS